MIDTHSHIYLSQFDDDRPQTIQRAKEAGVSAILMPNIDMDSVPLMYQQCHEFPGYCFPMAGLHPTNVRDDYKKQLADVEKQLANNNIVGVGETGIDLYWDKTTLKEQIVCFEYQLKLAEEKKLPIIIHARDSIQEIFAILDKYNGTLPTGVFHCFSGDLPAAQRVIDFGMHLGIGGVVTFKNGGLTEIIRNIPHEKIVVETDSPYLAPVPFRGKRNEPSYLKLVVDKIAEILEIDFDTVVAQTIKNSASLFPIKPL